MDAVASDRRSASETMPEPRRSRCVRPLFAARTGLRAVGLGALLCFAPSLAAAQNAGDGWITRVEPAAAPAAVDRPFNPGEPSLTGETGLSISIEDDLGGEPLLTPTEDGFVVVRQPLMRGGEGGPYFGAGLGVEATTGYNDGHGEVAGKIVGGVSAPVSDTMSLYGEYQHMRRLEAGEALDRWQFGLRRKF